MSRLPCPPGTSPELSCSRQSSPEPLSPKLGVRPSSTPASPRSQLIRHGAGAQRKRPHVQVTRARVPSLLRSLLPHSPPAAGDSQTAGAEPAAIVPGTESASTSYSDLDSGFEPTGSALQALLGRISSLEAQAQRNAYVVERLQLLEAIAQEHAKDIERLEADNRELKRRMLEADLCKMKAHTKPLSVSQQPATCSPPANLLTVVQLEGFESQIAHCISPCTGNRRFAGKVGWNKLQKTCRALRAVPVPLEMDPSVRIVPDNFPTIRRAIQNVHKHDKLDYAKVVIRPRETPYTEQLVIDRRVALMADPSASKKPEIHGRISIEESARGTSVQGLAVSNNNPQDPWGSAIDVNGTKDVHIANCMLSSSANDETVLKLCNCVATVRNNVIDGGQTHGVTGISIHGQTTTTIVENTIVDNGVGVYLNPTATVRLSLNRIERNNKGVQLNEDDIESIVEQGGFGQILLRQNTFVDNLDGANTNRDETFLKSLEVLMHPLVRRLSLGFLPLEADPFAGRRDELGESCRAVSEQLIL